MPLTPGDVLTDDEHEGSISLAKNYMHLPSPGPVTVRKNNRI